MPELSEAKVSILENMQATPDGGLNPWEEIEFIDILELEEAGLIRKEFYGPSSRSVVKWYLTATGHQIILP